MPGSVFYFVLNMSITSALIIIVLLIVRAVFGRYIPKAYIFSMWGIVLFRMVVPVSLPSDFSLIGFITNRMAKTVVVPKVSDMVPDLSVLNSVQAASRYFPVEYKTRVLENVFGISGIVWLCGTAIFIISAIIIYYITAARLEKAVAVKDCRILGILRDRLNVKGRVSLYESAMVSSPVVFGVMNPRVVIPKGMPKDILEYALLHELSHIKRFDNLWRLIFIFSVCIHWFNPFAWISLYISGKDMEYACDEKVLKSMRDEERKPYANALLLLAFKQQSVLTSFGGTAVKGRIMNIAAYKRVSIIMAVITAIICVVLAVLLITNPVL